MTISQPFHIKNTLCSNPSTKLLYILGIAILYCVIITNKFMTDKNDLPRLLKSYNNPQYNEQASPVPIDSRECSIRFVIITDDNEENALALSLKSIWNMQSTLFTACVVVVMNSRKETERSIEKKMEIIKSSEFGKYSNLITWVGNRKKTSGVVSEFQTYLNDLNDEKNMFYIMTEGYSFCENAQYHIMNVIDEFRRRNYDSESRQHVGFRVSFGNINGFILPKYLLLKWIDSSAIKHNILIDVLEKKTVLTYRFQIMEAPNSDFPKCYESLVDEQYPFSFDLNSCSNSLFSPCDKEPSKDFTHDVVQEFVFPSSSKYALSEFENVRSVKCLNGENCNSCCEKDSMKCSSEYFPFINKCDELNVHNSCECKRESEGTPIAPYYKGSKCFVGLRRSLFTCESTPTNSISRLCPCIKSNA